jgi:hypothetical protein
MTFSIDDLPAPFGPMIAQSSRLRTSKLTSESAFTPPNASEMFSTESRTSPMARALLEGLMPPARERRSGRS